MANTFEKLPLSASVNGRQIALSTTASSVAATIHTTPAGITSTDEIWIYAYNNAVTSTVLSLLWGGDETSDLVKSTIESQSGRLLVVDGKLLNNGLAVKAYASVSGSMFLDGFVNRITTS